MALVLAAHPAAGHEGDDPVELGGFVGAHLFSPTNELGAYDDDPHGTSPADALTFGLRLGFRVAPRLRLEGELALTSTTSRSGGADLFVIGWRAHAVFQILDGKVAPFVLAGLGGSTLSSEKNDVLAQDTDMVPEAGAGARIALGPRTGLRLEGRLLLPPSTAGSGMTVDWELLAGVYATYGARPRPAPAAPAPEPDRDGDGIPDARDRCPDVPEDRDGFEDDDGCPDPDNDGDGILDKDDRCPGEPETVNGFEDEDGCPDEVPPAVKRFTGRIAGITFPSGSAKIDEGATWVLDAAARVLAAHPTLRLEIAGHTDDVGAPEANRRLALARADAVRTYLVGKGVAAGRLATVGVGSARPLDRARTQKGRARNRRVEFRILEERP